MKFSILMALMLSVAIPAGAKTKTEGLPHAKDVKLLNKRVFQKSSETKAKGRELLSGVLKASFEQLEADKSAYHSNGISKVSAANGKASAASLKREEGRVIEIKLGDELGGGSKIEDATGALPWGEGV